MAIPTYEALLLPFLQILEDGDTHTMRQVIDRLADLFALSPEERREMLPSGTRKFDNRVWFARLYLIKAGLIESPERGKVQITLRGKSLLAQRPKHLRARDLEQFEEFRTWMASFAKSRNQKQPPVSPESSAQTPEEMLNTAYQEHRRALVEELLNTLQHVSPSFFERLVVQLLVRMGYGGSFEDAAQAVGQSGDEGVDGIIKEDRLGLDVVYIQAKRWSQPVGRPELQKFVGALQGHRARKGVFITTSTFTREAREYVQKIDLRIVLVDGKQLAEYMIDHNLGVTTVATYALKRIDRDFFEEVI